MKTQYREMFDEVHASGRLKEEVMNMTKQERNRVVKKISMSFVLAAALAVLLAGTALAAAIGVPQTLQEWFGQQWTEAGGGEMPKEQSEIIESLVQPVGVTAISNGISITLDSVTAGEHSLWMLLKIEGTGQTEQRLWNFMEKKLTGGPMEKMQATMIDGQAAYPGSESSQTAGFTEDGAQMQLMIYDAPKGVNFLEGGDLTLTLGKMWSSHTKGPGDVEDTELEGRWALAFTLEPVEELEVLTAKDTKVSAQEIKWEDGKDQPDMIDRVVMVKNIRVTSLGVTYEMKKEESIYNMEAPSLRLKNGMEIIMFSGSSLEGKKEYFWSVPVDLSKVEALCFGDVAIPLEQPKK